MRLARSHALRLFCPVLMQMSYLHKQLSTRLHNVKLPYTDVVICVYVCVSFTVLGAHNA